MSEETPNAVEQKTPKVNKLTAADIDKKIEALEAGMQFKSVYYKHLQQRKRELESLKSRQ